MTTHKYSVQVSHDQGLGLPDLRAELARVNVILGANGTGKSRTINWLSANCTLFGRKDTDVLKIEGGRAITIPNDLRINRKNFAAYGSLKTAEDRRLTLRLGRLTERIEPVLFAIHLAGQNLKVEHSDAIVEWQRAGSEGQPPMRYHPPMDDLCRKFNHVFPDVRLSFEQENSTLYCERFGNKYSPGALSDGERQVLAMLADVAAHSNPRGVILVDEPELNLEPTLACRLWDAIEDGLPDAIFVYATHSLSFALRQNVEKVIVLRGGQQPAIALEKEELVRSSMYEIS